MPIVIGALMMARESIREAEGLDRLGETMKIVLEGVTESDGSLFEVARAFGLVAVARPEAAEEAEAVAAEAGVPAAVEEVVMVPALQQIRAMRYSLATWRQDRKRIIEELVPEVLNNEPQGLAELIGIAVDSQVDEAVRGAVERELTRLFAGRKLLGVFLALDESGFARLEESDGLRQLVPAAIEAIDSPQALLELYRACGSDAARELVADTFETVIGGLKVTERQALMVQPDFEQYPQALGEIVRASLVEIIADEEALAEIFAGFAQLERAQSQKATAKITKKMSKKERQRLAAKERQIAQKIQAIPLPDKEKLSERLFPIFNRNPGRVLSFLAEKRGQVGYTGICRALATNAIQTKGSILLLGHRYYRSILKDKTVGPVCLDLLLNWVEIVPKEKRSAMIKLAAVTICDSEIYAQDAG